MPLAIAIIQDLSYGSGEILVISRHTDLQNPRDIATFLALEAKCGTHDIQQILIVENGEIYYVPGRLNKPANEPPQVTKTLIGGKDF